MLAPAESRPEAAPAGKNQHAISMGAPPRMPSFKPLPYIAPCIVALFSTSAFGVDVGGSIRFSDENFSVDIQTTDRVLRLTALGCNNFDLLLQPASRSAELVLHDSRGRNLGSLAGERTIETRTCGEERYSTQISFGAPTRTTWIPQADELVGAKKVKYSAKLSPTEIRFEPPIEMLVYEKNTRSRPVRIANVASAAVQGELPVIYSSNALHFSTARGVIHRTGGFAPNDEFFVESESQRFSRPANGQAEEIAFTGPSDRPASLSLYYPIGGPHILAFGSDEGQREPTQLRSLRIDGEQLLTPPFAILRSEPLIVKRGFFRFFSGNGLTGGAVQIQLGSEGSDVSNIRVTSSAPTILQLAQSASGPFAPSLEIAKIHGAAPLDIALQFRSHDDLSLGPHNYKLIVTGEGGLRRDIPITVDVTDPFAGTRTLVFVGFIALIVALALWWGIKRQRAASRSADIRAIFFQKHYGDYSEIRERIEDALASDITWLKAATVLEEFEEKQLQTALTTQQWNGIRELAVQQKAREALEALDRALARAEG
jgi:hypothetical protein